MSTQWRDENGQWTNDYFSPNSPDRPGGIPGPIPADLTPEQVEAWGDIFKDWLGKPKQIGYTPEKGDEHERDV